MSHRHFCEHAGHDWQCDKDRQCVCGLPMEGPDHSDCPVELRPCPEHEASRDRTWGEAISSEADAAFVQRCQEREAALPDCTCGCAEAETSKIVGRCCHCDRVYLDDSPVIEDRHFANDCPDVPEEAKKSARERLAKHRTDK